MDQFLRSRDPQWICKGWNGVRPFDSAQGPERFFAPLRMTIHILLWASLRMTIEAYLVSLTNYLAILTNNSVILRERSDRRIYHSA